MNTQEAKELALANQKEFVQWVTDWHGPCHIEICLIKNELWLYNMGQATFDSLFKVVSEEDGDWESFKFYIDNNTYANNH